MPLTLQNLDAATRKAMIAEIDSDVIRSCASARASDVAALSFTTA